MHGEGAGFLVLLACTCTYLHAEAIEKDSEGIPGWKDRLERLCVYRDELKKTVDVQQKLAKVQLANDVV